MKKKYLLIRDINNKFVAYDKGLVHTKEVWLAAKNWLEIDESDFHNRKIFVRNTFINRLIFNFQNRG